jgi:uncharacterized protein (DUF433 family)
MLEAKIIKTGRGPEIAGTRITVYDVIEYDKTGWHRDRIAAILSLSSHQVKAAIQYIEEHRDEVMASYEKNMERIRQGNPPELQAKLDAGHERFLAMVRERREAKKREGQDAGIPADKVEDAVGSRERVPQVGAGTMLEAKIIDRG